MLDLDEIMFSKLLEITSTIFQNCAPKEPKKTAAAIKVQCKFKTQAAAQRLIQEKLNLHDSEHQYVLNGYNHDKIVITDVHGTVKKILPVTSNLTNAIYLIEKQDKANELMAEVLKDEASVIEKDEEEEKDKSKKQEDDNENEDE